MQQISEHKRQLLKLSLVSGIGPRLLPRLLEHFGSAQAVFEASLSQLGQVEKVGPHVASSIQAARNDGLVDRVVEHCNDNGVKLLCIDEATYPKLLLELHDPPVVLYMRGELTKSDELSIGIVGSRHATPYGRMATELFARGLARANLTIVSGLARGIDTIAHRSALEVGGRTIAFLGSSVTDVYPSENKKLAEEVANQGAVLSETHPFARTKPGVFPQRNRLISGISLGVIIVEAAERSGALITASHAGEQGRDLFAVPGSIQSRMSRGTNKLIRDGAILVQDPNDVIDHLGPLFEHVTLDDQTTIRHPAEMKLNEPEMKVLQAIDSEPTDMDVIVAKSGLNVSAVLATISVLQMRKLIRRISARLVQRV